MTDLIPRAITDAVATLWRRRGPRPDNTFETPEFLGLKAACIASYPVGGAFWFTMSLWEILRSLGCPMLLPADKQDLALTADLATEKLHRAMTATMTKIVHLCPLDWADRPPSVVFGGRPTGSSGSTDLPKMPVW
ncbi:hypothetical protein [Mesorhizobium sp.]|uniref:hypothetical protein n=1 Tax=Mesorhizobium sp. TaxID=1871066 RepID=UPI000FE4CA2E|nr:hypothetical protein [Mesorhizobium sp.]RWK65599.1 MAG: hypothetical protein EOR49_00370 [Mesorhizobium sp.]RWM53817.1 MAG: hypothetical protein EOR76_01015 [Mesorhizobium sp.]RWM54631.1 MAG: hypothetical protein EOR79_24180 [Mesorhizobium sp.]RWM60815.1 MAG: hypothetical protein EOR78_02475 [Mesorhizobium sp.]RWM95190.1 MAG: hypothetical protein EOR85_24610 [Mesorhizobium sp.]